MLGPTDQENEVARQVVDCAFAVHTTLGPGLLESIYEQCLVHELHARGIATQRQVMVPIVYKAHPVDGGLRMDLLVANLIVVEVKAIETLMPLHKAQLLTYLKLSRHRLGLLINAMSLSSKTASDAWSPHHDHILCAFVSSCSLKQPFIKADRMAIKPISPLSSNA